MVEQLNFVAANVFVVSGLREPSFSGVETE